GCSVLPVGCACKESDARLSVSCVSVPLASVLPSLAGRTVDALRAVNCSMPALERRQLTMKGLRTLELAHCGIAAVDPEAFAVVSRWLEDLSLFDNRLTAVPAGLAPLPALTKLNLNRNLISSLPPGALSFAPRLSQLRLEDNRICELGLNSLNETKSILALLDLSGNCLASLASVGALRSAPALAYLDLSGNKLTELAPLSLLSLPSLIELRLSDNLLARLSPLALSGTEELRYLYLQNNLLDSLAALPQLAKLEILDARANRLTKMPLLSSSPGLKQLRLDSNRISAVESRALVDCKQLQLLSLQDNLLSSLDSASFEGLQQLVVLLLSNNQLETLELDHLQPLRLLQQLNLRNNSISSIGPSALSPLKQLTTLDMGDNELTKVDKGLFEPLPKLFWLDLSGNALATFEKGTFTRRISNLLLDGNPIVCDEALDWFVQWLVVNRVRTYLPNQPDAVCKAPPAYEGVKLKELMIKKANETMKVMGLQPEKPTAGKALVNNLLPGMSIMNSLVPAGQQAAQAAAGLGQIPGLGALLNGIPSLRDLPLGHAAPAASAPSGASPAPGTVRSMNTAVEQFAAPLVRFATGGQPQAADFEQLMQAIPRMIEAAPGGAAAAIDVSKLPPNMIAHVLRGGQIPGIPKDTMERLIAGHMQKMAEVAAAIGRGEAPKDVEKYLPPLSSLPPELITSVMSGQSMPGLRPDQIEPIKQYYLNTLPQAPGASGAPSASGAVASAAPAPAHSLGAFELTPQTLDMMRLLPAGYDLTKIPGQIMSALSRGEIPDLKLLPAELQEHLKANTDRMLAMFQGGSGGERGEMGYKQDLREVLEKLPNWERPVETATYSPYYMNAKKAPPTAEELARAHTYRLMTACVIGLLALVSVIAVVSLCVAQRRKLAGGNLESTGGASNIDGMRGFSTPALHSSHPRDSTHISQQLQPQQHGVVHRRSPTQNI
ncbi:hypothetical protein PFISCL1PPCAC_5257, partial [Pristionchus fissidentatus]